MKNEKQSAQSPFSSLGVIHEEGWQEVLEDDGTKKIIIPKGHIKQLTAFRDNVDIETNLAVRAISQEEIDAGFFIVPRDTINLSRVETDKLLAEDEFEHSIIIQVRNFFKALHGMHPDLTRNQICFSKSQKEIIILPTIKD